MTVSCMKASMVLINSSVCLCVLVTGNMAQELVVQQTTLYGKSWSTRRLPCLLHADGRDLDNTMQQLRALSQSQQQPSPVAMQPSADGTSMPDAPAQPPGSIPVDGRGAGITKEAIRARRKRSAAPRASALPALAVSPPSCHPALLWMLRAHSSSVQECLGKMVGASSYVHLFLDIAHGISVACGYGLLLPCGIQLRCLSGLLRRENSWHPSFRVGAGIAPIDRKAASLSYGIPLQKCLHADKLHLHNCQLC